jgi:hypothetical protein
MYSLSRLPFLFFCAFSFWSEGCFGSGTGFTGGTGRHVPPTAIYTGQESTLEFQESITGDPGRGVSARYSDEKVYFRVDGKKDYQQAETKREIIDNKHMVIRAKIPAIHVENAKKLEYYYEVRLDGHLNSFGNREKPKTIAIREQQK